MMIIIIMCAVFTDIKQFNSKKKTEDIYKTVKRLNKLDYKKTVIV